MSAAYSEIYNEALDAYKAEDVERAHALVKQILAQTLDDPEVWCLEAQIRLAREEWEETDFAIEQALKLDPEAFAPYFIQTHLYSACERYEEAQEAAEQAIAHAKTDEQKRDAWLQLADACFGIGHSRLKEAAEEADDEEEVMSSEIAGVFQTGMEAVETVIELDPKLPDAWELYANFLAIFHNTEEALEAWRTAVELAPDNPEYLHGLGQALEDIEDFEEAHDVFYQLYHLEQRLFAEGQEPLLFSPEEFSSTAHDVWAEIQHELVDEEMPLVFECTVDVYPDESLIEEASADALFDPRVGIHVELVADPFASMSDNPAPPVVRLHLFQRNIERDLDSDDKDELVDVLEELLASCIEQVYEYMGAPEEEW